MGESRSKKAKKAQWQLTLGVRDLIFAALGMAGLVMLSFALGTMAGRGDIYRLLHNWGLLGQDNHRALQTLPALAPSVATVPVSQVTQSPAPLEIQNPSPPAVPQPASPPPPVKGHLAAIPSPAAPEASAKKAPGHAADKEDKLEKIRREVANKLKFQNSLDLAATRKTLPAAKDAKDKDGFRNAPQPVLVAKFRDGGQARQKLAQLQKQGEKVFLKEGNDGEGHYYALYRQVAGTPAKSQAQALGGKKARPESGSSKNIHP